MRSAGEFAVRLFVLSSTLALVAGCASSSGATGSSGPAQKVAESSWLPVASSPARGPSDAEVTAVVFDDPLCESCAETMERLESLREGADDLRVVYKYYPGDGEAHRLAARALAFADQQGAFWEFHEAAVSNREAIRKAPREELIAVAEANGLDAKSLDERLAEVTRELPAVVRRDLEVGRDLGLRRPPAVVVNGRVLDGPRALEGLESEIDAQRRRAGAALEDGVGREELYRVLADRAYGAQGIHERDRYAGAIKLNPRAMKDSPKIPVGDSPVRGPEDAPVTIVEFSEFQCPFCQKGQKRLKKVRENYPDQVRVVFKHFPLPFHKSAKPAGRAALAAGEQGAFWEMHDRLFERQARWKNGDVREITAGWAEEMGLDVEQFRDDFDNESYGTRMEKDMKFGKKLGVKGTPHFFINGEGFSGAQPYRKFESVIDQRLDQVESLRSEEGVGRRDIYREAVARNYSPPSNEGAGDEPGDPAAAEGDDNTVEHVPVGDRDAVRGASADEALVTVVEFAEFQCPFSRKASPTFDKLIERYGDEVRFVFKHRPLSMHDQAKPAARAAMAAQKQGKFWEMHDLMFENQKDLERGEEAFVELAEQLDLDVSKFREDLASDELERRLERDIELAAEVRAKGTPTTFINGVKITGAQPMRKFESVVESQLEKARTIRDERDLTGDALYEAVVEANREGDQKEGQAEADAPAPDGDAIGEKVDASDLQVGDSPVRGAEDAELTIYEFSEFECRFSRKARAPIDKVLDKYGERVRIVHKQYLLPMHDNARPAARAAMAAQRQGKYWEMFELMFDNQKKLGEEGIFEKWAEKLEMDVSKFRRDMEADVFEKRLEREKQMGTDVGVKGTPTFIIGDRRIVGAHPFEKFESLIEAQLDN